MIFTGKHCFLVCKIHRLALLKLIRFPFVRSSISRSIKYSIWCSTEHGNMKLDNAFKEQMSIGPVYLFYSVNGSGHFCGVAQMVSPVDYNASSGVWAQDKWKVSLDSFRYFNFFN